MQVLIGYFKDATTDAGSSRRTSRPTPCAAERGGVEPLILNAATITEIARRSTSTRCSFPAGRHKLDVPRHGQLRRPRRRPAVGEDRRSATPQRRGKWRAARMIAAQRADHRVLNADDFRHYVDALQRRPTSRTSSTSIPNAAAWDWMTQRTSRCSPAPTRRSRRSTTTAGGRSASTSSRRRPASIVTEFISRCATRARTTASAAPWAITSPKGAGSATSGSSTSTRASGSAAARTAGRSTASTTTASGPPRRCSSGARVTRRRRRCCSTCCDDLVADYATWEDEKLPPRRAVLAVRRLGRHGGVDQRLAQAQERPADDQQLHVRQRPGDRGDRDDGRASATSPTTFATKAAELKTLVQEKLWDERREVLQGADGGRAALRCPRGDRLHPVVLQPPRARGYEEAWAQLVDPRRLLGAVRHHDRRAPPPALPLARRRQVRVGRRGLAVRDVADARRAGQRAAPLRSAVRHEAALPRRDAARTRSRTSKNGKPYIGEYLDETTGEWLKGDNPRSRYYNHSTFCDLVIAGLVGLVPRGDDDDRGRTRCSRRTRGTGSASTTSRTTAAR